MASPQQRVRTNVHSSAKALMLLLVLLLGVGTQPAFGHPANASDTKQITAVILSKMKNEAVVSVGGIITDGGYALVSWRTIDGNGAGSALLIHKGATWKVLIHGGGSVADAAYLSKKFHVPSSTAAALVSEFLAPPSPNIAPTP